jgi:hypothetical protein
MGAGMDKHGAATAPGPLGNVGALASGATYTIKHGCAVIAPASASSVSDTVASVSPASCDMFEIIRHTPTITLFGLFALFDAVDPVDPVDPLVDSPIEPDAEPDTEPDTEPSQDAAEGDIPASALATKALRLARIAWVSRSSRDAALASSASLRG